MSEITNETKGVWKLRGIGADAEETYSGKDWYLLYEERENAGASGVETVFTIDVSFLIHEEIKRMKHRSRNEN